jgi:CMP/dCMP kinase
MAVITISRQSGSEGNEVARLLCARLDYRYFDKGLMAELGEAMGLAPDEITDASVEEHHVKTLLERLFGTYPDPMTNPTVWTEAMLQDAREARSVAQVRRLILAAYDLGNVVVIGRGGQVVLGDKPDVLHVRVVAPMETRIRRWQEREGLTAKEARKKTHERNRAHVDFVKRFFDVDLNDPELYDLVISTEKIMPAEAVELIVQAMAYLPVP